MGTSVSNLLPSQYREAAEVLIPLGELTGRGGVVSWRRLTQTIFPFINNLDSR